MFKCYVDEFFEGHCSSLIVIHMPGSPFSPRLWSGPSTSFHESSSSIPASTMPSTIALVVGARLFGSHRPLRCFCMCAVMWTGVSMGGVPVAAFFPALRHAAVSFALGMWCMRSLAFRNLAGAGMKKVILFIVLLVVG